MMHAVTMILRAVTMATGFFIGIAGMYQVPEPQISRPQPTAQLRSSLGPRISPWGPSVEKPGNKAPTEAALDAAKEKAMNDTSENAFSPPLLQQSRASPDPEPFANRSNVFVGSL
ncbi:uncharacterized protein BDZ99DRAFT_170415 [Mytilinidion resinicola]|uniref:Uncharacterized protein n=1 Tax=Mytilinidion resinicola TaxID=574789 RepID=A0A6A6Y4Y9_9PEZI|nr:uncharacterized protein BDZ99DRAFT_170415 [Mytilinidion resinicola]KAF2803295.1 hypothetical protein BDZ99DRAFT_170415 [Mytilinidion resinicola]